MTATIHQQTLELLEMDRGQWPETCRQVGIDYNWLQKLAQKKIADPGVNKMEKLHAYLKQKYQA